MAEQIAAGRAGPPGCPGQHTYVRRQPERTVLHHVVREHLETFLAEARLRAGGEGLPRFVERELREFLNCGAMARGFARGSAGLAGVLHTILLAINDPFTLAERRVLSAELCELAVEIGGLELQFLAAYPAVGVQLESGAVLEAEASLRTMERVARELRQPFYAWWAQIGRAMWSLMRGDADAERQVMTAFEIGTVGGQPDAATAFGAQLFAVREHQGRLAELTDAMQANVEAMPHIGWRAGFAFLPGTPPAPSRSSPPAAPRPSSSAWRASSCASSA